MNVPKAWIEVLCLISLSGHLYANIDSKEYFCGKKLVRTLTELCSVYNHPVTGHNRFRRQIIEECCRSQCSRRYLVQYYCLEAHSSVVNLIKATPEIPSKAASEKHATDFQSVSSVTKSEEKKSLNVGSLQSNKTTSSTHGKRNCKCRKRRAKRLKKLRRLQSPRNMIQNPVPPPNIGHVEHSQKPFYVWKLFRAY